MLSPSGSRTAPQFDCVVLGGGPAGATAAALVAEAGFSTLLVERDAGPRDEGGQTITGAGPLLARLGLLHRLQESAFPRCPGLRVLSPTGRELHRFDAAPADDNRPLAWQAARSDFDAWLWERAAAGACCRRETRALEVLFDGNSVAGVRVQDSAGGEQRIGTRAVIDATGRHALLANQLGQRMAADGPPRAAIWAQYRGGRRELGPEEGATLVFATRHERAWFWYLPLANDRVCVGVTAPENYLLSGRGRAASVFEEELTGCPAVLDRLVDAQWASEFRMARDVEAVSREAAGNGWVLAGDALASAAPPFWPGLLGALHGGARAADAVVAGLRDGDLSAERLARPTRGCLLAWRRLRALVAALQAGDGRLAGFCDAFPAHRAPLAAVFSGSLFSEGHEEMFADFEQWVERLDDAGDDSGVKSVGAPPGPPGLGNEL